MTVHFIGAGPGAVDLLTLRGYKILSKCSVCLYAGSIVPKEMLDFCPTNATLIDTAPLNLDQIEAEYVKAHQAGQDIARLHSGDLSVYSAVSEQIRRLQKNNIPYTLTPGVPAFAAAAALIEKEFTIPEVAQSVVLTRISGRASTMPSSEALENFAKTGCTLVLHLAIHRLEDIVERLIPFYGTNCPIIIAARVTWENEQILKATLGTIIKQFNDQPIERTALIMVGSALHDHQETESALYNTEYQRRFKTK